MQFLPLHILNCSIIISHSLIRISLQTDHCLTIRYFPSLKSAEQSERTSTQSFQVSRQSTRSLGSFVRFRAGSSQGRGSHARLRSVRIAQPPLKSSARLIENAIINCGFTSDKRKKTSTPSCRPFFQICLGSSSKRTMLSRHDGSVVTRHASRAIRLLLTRGLVARPCQSLGEGLNRQMARRSFRSTLPALECPQRGACRRCRLSWSFFPRHDQVTGPWPFFRPYDLSHSR